MIGRGSLTLKLKHSSEFNAPSIRHPGFRPLLSGKISPHSGKQAMTTVLCHRSMQRLEKRLPREPLALRA
jgi:hypothetical protein